jgi:threonine dehydrogenase-like Zn-dependent dehydrogenase
VVSVLGVRIPSYTRDIVEGRIDRGLQTPLILGPTCIGRVERVGRHVFDLEPGQIVLCNSLLSSGDLGRPSDSVMIGWMGRASGRARTMHEAWRDGSFAERAHYPGSALTPLPGAEAWDPARLTLIVSLAIAIAGLKRGGMAGGKAVIVTGATGQLGSAAVLYALSRGARRVVAVGRNPSKLERLAGLDRRVTPFIPSGDRRLDALALVNLCDGGADILSDNLGPTPTADVTLAGIDALRRDGVAVLLGGVERNLPLSYSQILQRRLTVTSSSMFDRETALEAWYLMKGGTVDFNMWSTRSFSLAEIEQAMDAAHDVQDFELAVLTPQA